MSNVTLAVIGNPNAGKTTLFNDLTGAKQYTGNWPGVTVTRKEGRFSIGGQEFVLVDLPGTYSVDSENPSIDERVARDYIESNEADLLINIVDASNLERSLYLTAQLLEMSVPMVVSLNMIDVADKLGYQIDTDLLSQQLGVPVVPLVATQKNGIEELKKQILETLASSATQAEQRPAYVENLETALTQIGSTVEQQSGQQPSRWQALQILSAHRAPAKDQELRGQAAKFRESLEKDYDEDLDLIIADGRYQFANERAKASLTKKQDVSEKHSDKIDSLILHPWLGVPIFLFIMYLMFTFTINIGGAFIDFFDIATGALLIDGVGSVLESIGSPDWLRVLIANGIGGGIQVVATFVPIIAFLYLFLSVLEDSGYMARAAFVMDRLMQKMGLPGKAFVPLIVGFGCNVPAIMAARTLDVHRERIMTVMMAPFMSCGARLSVYALFAATFFAEGGQNIVFLLYLIGILAAMGTAFMLKSTVLKGEAESFLMELPTYQMPTLQGVFTHTWNKLKGFVSDAGKYIVIMVVVINVLNSWGTDGSFGNEDSEQSVLSAIGRTITPVFEPLGIEEDNWPATVGIFTGVLAKEVVVGTLDAIYSQLDRQEASAEGTEEPAPSVIEGLQEAVATIPANLADIINLLGDPLGFSIVGEDAEGLEVEEQTFAAMAKRFDGQVGAFAYLLFVLLYFPCVAATAAIKRETDWNWTLFAIGWTTLLAYTASTAFYQLATWSQHPVQSMIWLAVFIGFLLLVFVLLRIIGSRGQKAGALQNQTVS